MSWFTRKQDAGDKFDKCRCTAFVRCAKCWLELMESPPPPQTFTLEQVEAAYSHACMHGYVGGNPRPGAAWRERFLAALTGDGK